MRSEQTAAESGARGLITLYSMVAMGQDVGQLDFYDQAGWAVLWADPYSMIFNTDFAAFARYWKLYVISYELDIEPDDFARLREHGNITMDKRTLAGKYGRSCYGGRDLMCLGNVGAFQDIQDQLQETGKL